MPIHTLGIVKDGDKYEIPVISALPREMTMAEFALLSDAEKLGDIIVTDYPVNEESDYVEVVTDGVKSISALLIELYALIDGSRVCDFSCLEYDTNIFSVNRVDVTYGFIDCGAYYGGASSPYVYIDRVRLGSSGFAAFVTFTPSGSTNHSSEVPTSGKTMRFYYNDAHTFDFNTKAENCIYGNSNVKDALDDGVDIIKRAYSGKELVYSALPISSTELHLDLPACLGNPTSVSVTRITEMGVGNKSYDHWTADSNGTSVWITNGTVTLGRYSSVVATLTWS